MNYTFIKIFKVSCIPLDIAFAYTAHSGIQQALKYLNEKKKKNLMNECTVHGVTRVGHDLATKPLQWMSEKISVVHNVIKYREYNTTF